MLLFIFVKKKCYLFEWNRICAGLLLLGYKSINVGGLVIKRGRAGIPLNCLAPPHCAAIPKPRPGCTSCYVVALHFVYSGELR